MSLGVCLVGCGFIGSVHAERWRRIKETDLVTCVDVEKGRTENFGATYGFKHSSTNLADSLRDKEIDVVDVCTPTYTHKDIVLACMDSHKHVLVEKPIALKLSDAKEMISKAEAQGLRLMVAHVLRFWGEYVAAKKLIADDAIGRPAMARAYRHSPFPEWVWMNWHDHRDKGGGVFVDMSIHDVDFLRWSLGEVTEVYAQGGTYARKGASAHDYTHASLKFESGAVAYVEGSWMMPPGYPFSTSLEVAGSEGVIQVDNQSTASLSMYVGGKVERITPAERDGYFAEIEDFVRSVLRGSPPSVSGREGLRSLEVALAALQSVLTGSPVKIPLGGEPIE